MTHSAPRATIEPNAKANVAKNLGSSMKDILTALATNRPVTHSSGYGRQRQSQPVAQTTAIGVERT